jgi:hypothetical protein
MRHANDPDPDEPDDFELPDDPDDEAMLDDEFPLGDGVADTAGFVYCPYCGEENEVSLDPGGGPVQAYVEDCHVCCRPWQVVVRYQHDGTAVVSVQTSDED